ncbi:hypothetical protein BH09MYX1_BH09MYX1_36000 [soil metagenome]
MLESKTTVTIGSSSTSGWHVDASIAARWILVGLSVGIAVTYIVMSERGRSERESLNGAIASANAARAEASVNAIQAAASASQAGFNAGLAAAPTCPPAPSAVVAHGSGGGHGVGHTPASGGEIDDSAMLGPLLGAAMGAMGGTAPTGSAGEPPVGPIPLP